MGAAALVTLAACGGGQSGTPPSGGGGHKSAHSGGGATTTTSAPVGQPMKGGTATVEVLYGSQPNWIWPFEPVTYYTGANGYTGTMYRSLYLFGGENQSVKVNYGLSPAKAPVYSDGGKTVTIHLKGWKWSNGETVDAQDVEFWINMAKAEKQNLGAYVPGGLPDNLKSFSIPSRDTLVMHLTKAYSSTWFTYNQLAIVIPMPMAWDVTSLHAKPGSGGCHLDVSKCPAVYRFLYSQSKDTSTYATSPLWQVVDGPWRLKSFTTSGHDVLVANKKYSGSPKPKLAAWQYVPYSSDANAYTALKSGTLDYASVPSADLPQRPAGQAVPNPSPLGTSYKLYPDYPYVVYYWEPNYNNPTIGPAFRQEYFRHALQYLMDQEGMVKAVYRGYGYPTAGVVPSRPASSPFLPPLEKEHGGQGPYPFSISKATHLLTSHGWKEVNGVMTCETPAKCGHGVAAGTKARFTMMYSTQPSAFAQQVDVYKSDASKAGIQIKPEGQTFNTIIGEASTKNHSWQAVDFGGWGYNGPGYLPTGEPLFETHSQNNTGGYSNPEMDRLIKEVEVNGSRSLFDHYATFATEQAPFIWTPTNYAVYAVKSNLHGVAFNPLGSFLPEYWYFTK